MNLYSITGFSQTRKQLANKIAREYDFYLLEAGLVYRALAYLALQEGKSMEQLVDYFFQGKAQYIWNGQKASVKYNKQDITEHLSADLVGDVICDYMKNPENQVLLNQLVDWLIQKVEKENKYSKILVSGKEAGTSYAIESISKFFVVGEDCSQEEKERFFRDQTREYNPIKSQESQNKLVVKSNKVSKTAQRIAYAFGLERSQKAYQKVMEVVSQTIVFRNYFENQNLPKVVDTSFVFSLIQDNILAEIELIVKTIQNEMSSLEKEGINTTQFKLQLKPLLRIIVKIRKLSQNVFAKCTQQLKDNYQSILLNILLEDFCTNLKNLENKLRKLLTVVYVVPMNNFRYSVRLLWVEPALLNIPPRCI